MIEKRLGKIDFAEYGTYPDRPFLMGLMLGFSMEGGTSGVMTGGKFTVNVSDDCKWLPEQRNDAIAGEVILLRDILKDAKCNYVSELVNKPVEVTIDGGMFSDFRILTEVL